MAVASLRVPPPSPQTASAGLKREITRRCRGRTVTLVGKPEEGGFEYFLVFNSPRAPVGSPGGTRVHGSLATQGGHLRPHHPPPVFSSRPGAPPATALTPGMGLAGGRGAEPCRIRAERDEPAVAPGLQGEGRQHFAVSPRPARGSPPGGAAPRGSRPARPPGALPGCARVLRLSGVSPLSHGAADLCQTWALTARWRSSRRCQAVFNWHLGLPFCENSSSSLCFFSSSILF